MIEETLKAISGENKTDYNDWLRPTWKELLELLGMSYACFEDEDEEREAYSFIREIIQAKGSNWVKNHARFCINEWENYKDEYRKQKEKKRKRGKELKRLIEQSLEDETLYDYINRKKGKQYQ